MSSSWSLLTLSAAAVALLVAVVAPASVDCAPPGRASSNGLGLGQLLMGSPADQPAGSASSNNGLALGQLLMGATADLASNGNSAQGHEHAQQPGHVPTFDTVEELCEWLCRKSVFLFVLLLLLSLFGF